MNLFCKVINHTTAPNPSAEDLTKPKQDEEKRNSNGTPSNETVQEKGLSDEDVNQLSMVEFRSQSYASFYQTTMEKDKAILSLSVAGIGFLITLLNLSKTLGVTDFALFIAAAAGFLSAIFCIIRIFSLNADYITTVVNGENASVIDFKMKRFDCIAIWTFFIGILMTILLGLSASTPLFLTENNNMSDNKTTSCQPPSMPVFDSCTGAEELTKSFSGANKITPQALSTSTTTNNAQNNGAPGIMPTKSDK